MNKADWFVMGLVASAFLYWLVSWIFQNVAPPVARAIVDVNARCPACGHRNGKLRCVVTAEGSSIEHDCQVCGAKFYEPTIVKGEAWMAKEAITVRR